LSLSASPAFAPCGMPFFVELVAPPPALEEVLLDDVAPEDPDEAELAEPDELEPHAATARATRTSASGASLRIDLGVCCLMDLLLRVRSL
jgi:hypothetical protein